MKLTRRTLAQRGKLISIRIDSGRFQMAKLAYEAKEQAKTDPDLADWAERLANLPHVRKADRTVREWAQAWEFYALCPKKWKLPFSFYARASRYLDRLDFETICDALETASVAKEINVDQFGSHLAKCANAEAGFSLADALDELGRKADKLAEDADTDADREVLRAVWDFIDTKRAALVPVNGKVSE